MAIFKKTFTGDFDRLVTKVKDTVMRGSASASFEHGADYRTPTGRCSVMVFERYSWLGNNRVSMSVTLFQSGDRIELCAVHLQPNFRLRSARRLRHHLRQIRFLVSGQL